MVKVARKPKFPPARRRDGIRAAPALAVLLLAPGLSGCILGSERPELNLEVPAAYREAQTHSPDTAVPALDWWRGFRSKELTTLMEDAQVFNLDIAVAVAQIVQADAQVGVSGSPLLPSVTGTATAEREKVSTATSGGGLGPSTFSNYNVGLTASYMIDFWGKNRATLYSAEESATAARYNREVVTLTTLVTVANTYFQVLAAQDELRVARRNLAAAERILTLIKQQFAGGTASQLDLSQQEALVSTERAAIPPLEVTLKQNTAALALLVARAPANFNVRGGALTSIVVPKVTPGMPSELLYQRPDIRQAEAQLASSNFSVESARAAFFPQIQLTATTGVQSASLAALFGPGAWFYTLSAGLTQP
ncbi:MAG TPA: efflux transporter outer membrane subunit, partial [Bradyrhizobium sp.]